MVDHVYEHLSYMVHVVIGTCIVVGAGVLGLVFARGKPRGYHHIKEARDLLSEKPYDPEPLRRRSKIEEPDGDDATEGDSE